MTPRLKTENPFRFSPFRVLLLAIVLSACGIAVVPFLSIQLNPPPRTHSLQVSYSLPGSTPETIESDVTAPLERIFSSIEGIENIQSRSSNGHGNISLTFSEKQDIGEKRLEVSTRIRQVYPKLPPHSSYPVISYRSEFQKEQHLLTYAVNSSLPAYELNDFLSKNLLPEIAAQAGISSVNIYGASPQELYLALNPGKMNARSLTAQTVIQALKGSIDKQELGKIRTGADRLQPSYHYLLYSGQGIHQPPEDYIPDIPIVQENNRTIYIRDVGRIYSREAPRTGYYRINGLESVNLSIAADRSANLMRLSKKIQEIVQDFEAVHQERIHIFESYNAADFLERELSKITNRSLATLVILLLFIILLYRNVRQIFLIFISLSVTLLIASLCYFLLNISLHLYSIAGLTLSLGIILDNILIMSDHIRKKGNRHIFLAILAATLTTIGALAAIFLIDKSQRENLVDFFTIFSVNLLVSLATALVLIPALSVILGIRGRPKLRFHLSPFVRFFNRSYLAYGRMTSRFRWLIPVLFVFLFGLPFFMLPSKIEKETPWADRYNSIQEVPLYANHIRPFMDKWLGGTFRLFYNHRDRFYFGSQRREETKLYLQAQMPAGGTVSQLNEVLLRIESYLKTFPEIRQFQLNINDPQNGRIEILFNEAAEDTGFPYRLKDELTSFAVSAGSADFRVWGVGDAFNNVLPGERVSTHIVLTGYNFDQIWHLARQSQEYLEEHPRIKKVFINSDVNFYIPQNFYYYLDFNDPASLLRNDIHLGMMMDHFDQTRRDQGVVAYWPVEGHPVPVRIVNELREEDQMWTFLHQPVLRDSSAYFRQKDILSLTREKGSNDIVRINQAYQLVLEYDFIGNFRLANKVLEESITEIGAALPIGYQVKSQNNYWGRDDDSTSILWIIIAGLFFIWIIGSILFNSLRQAIIPVVMIPFSYIGIFLITHFVDFRFGQGGLASFLLVGGLSVNAVFFIINDYNRLKKVRPGIPVSTAFLKAYNGKIIPILLTALSTILGLLPFIIFDKNDPFWYSLALCTIGGMIGSVIVLVFLLPVFFRFKVP